MKLVVGLGNPGQKYAQTRHNTGFLILDELKDRMANIQAPNSRQFQNFNFKLKTHKWNTSKKGQLEYIWLGGNGEKIELIKPLAMMNDSGKAVVYVKKKHPELKLEDIYVVHDDLDIALGSYKIQLGKGPRQHGGLDSIYKNLGSKDFWHVRVGIESRIQNSELGIHKISGEKYVLQKFTSGEREVLEKALDQVVDEMVERLQADK